jgi:transposase InsO family protein
MRGALSHSERVETVARGLCGAAPRRFGARIKWLPTINKVPASAGETEDDCFDFKIDAVAAAKRVRDQGRNLIAQANEGI